MCIAIAPKINFTTKKYHLCDKLLSRVCGVFSLQLHLISAIYPKFTRVEFFTDRKILFRPQRVY